MRRMHSATAYADHFWFTHHEPPAECANGFAGGAETIAHLLGIPAAEAPWSEDLPEDEMPLVDGDWLKSMFDIIPSA